MHTRDMLAMSLEIMDEKQLRVWAFPSSEIEPPSSQISLDKPV